MTLPVVGQAALVEVEIAGAALGAHPGAEVVGIVRTAAETAQHLFGRAVIVPRYLPCGECDLCRRGRIANCKLLQKRPIRPQAREVLPARFLLPLEPPYVADEPDEATLYRYAVFSDGLLAPYAGLVRAGVGPGTLCVVLGDGPRAALAVVVCRAIGAKAAVLCAHAEQRAALCMPPYEALRAIDANLDDEAVHAELRALGDEAGLPAHGICFLETSGSDHGRARTLGLLSAGATAVLLDAPEGETTRTAGVALLERVVNEGCQIIGAGPPHPDLLPELLALVERAGVSLDALTRAVAPSDIAAATAGMGGSAHEPLRLPIARFSGGSEQAS